MLLQKLGGGTVGSASGSTSDVPQQNGVEIKFHDQDDYNNVLPDYVYIPGKNPGDKITMTEIIGYLPAGLEITGNQPQEFEVTGEPYQSISIFVRHIIEQQEESKNVEQIIYGHYGTNREILDRQVVTFTRIVRVDRYTGKTIVVQDWQPSLTFQDYTVVPKDGFSANQPVVKGTTVNSNSDTVKINVTMKRNDVKQETSTVNRTIILYLPDGTTREIVQTVEFTRDVITNPWTNAVTYGEWTTANDSFDSYQAEEVDGVMPDRAEIGQVTVKPGTDSWVEEVRYPQNEVTTETRQVTRTIKLILPNGKTEYVRQTVTFTRQVIKKANGEIVYGEWDAPGKLFDDYSPAEVDGKKPDKTYIPRDVANPETKNYEVVVRYEAAHATTTEEKTVNRVIHLHHPNGTVETVNHAVTLTREVKTNLQTGEKEYGEWTTGQFAEFVVPTVDGHVPDVEKINLLEVNEATEDQVHHVNYLAHQVAAETKTVNRVIKVTMPDGTVKTITQTVTFVKHVTKHPVNGEVISETEWTIDGSGTWDEFIPEQINGYTPSQEKVAAVTPNVNDKDVLVEISYNQNNQPITPDKPVKPDQPETPDVPIIPDQPDTPDQPADSDQPDAPVDSDQPAEPDQPGTPDVPTTPDQPGSSAQPGVSDAPIESDQPTSSATSVDSENSGQPGNTGLVSSVTNAESAATPVITQLTSATTIKQDGAKNKNTQKESQDNQQLPQTGEKQSPGLITGTMLVLVTLFLQLLTFGLVKKKGKTE